MQSMKVKKLVTMHKLMKVEELHKNGDHEEENEHAEAWDDVTGAVLDPREVQRARMKELQYIHEKKI